MGCGEIDGSFREQLYNPSINTTDRLMEELYRTDFLMHIGDMSYAQGYAAIVRYVHLSLFGTGTIPFQYCVLWYLCHPLLSLLSVVVCTLFPLPPF